MSEHPQLRRLPENRMAPYELRDAINEQREILELVLDRLDILEDRIDASEGRIPQDLLQPTTIRTRWKAFSADELSAITSWATASGLTEILNDASEFGRFASKLYAELQREIDRRHGPEFP